MLTEDNDIDKLFHSALRDYEKTPPAAVWTNIANRLNSRQMGRRLLIRRLSGIAAALLLALFAGWWMFSISEKGDVQKNSLAEQAVIVNEQTTIHQTAQIPPSNTDSAGSKQDIAGKASKISTLAAFGANTSFIHSGVMSANPEPGERVLLDSEKKAIDNLEQNFKVVKKITEWIAAKVSSDTAAVTQSESMLKVVVPEKNFTIKFPATDQRYYASKSNGRWSLKAEFTPVFNSQVQVQNNTQLSYPSGIAQSYAPRQTNTANTLSAGLMAGYKISRRLTIKSGMTYNNIRQSTHNAFLLGADPMFNIAGNLMYAATPAGQVILHKDNDSRVAADYSSIAQSQNVALYTGETVLKQNIDFIEVPLKATYSLIDSRLNIGITGGINTGILVGNRVVLSGNGDRISTGETSNMRNVVYSGAVGLELGYEITNRITITVEPRLKHYINSLSTSKSVNYKPRQMEVATGLTYSFN
jgi:hypothetical protein